MTQMNITVQPLAKDSWSLKMAADFYKGHPLDEIVQRASGQFAAMNGMFMDFFSVQVELDGSPSKGIFGPVDRHIADGIKAICEGVAFSDFNEFEGAVKVRTKNDFNMASKIRGTIHCALQDALAKGQEVSVAENLSGREISTEIPCYASMITLDIDGPETEFTAKALAGLNFWGQKWHLPEGSSNQEAGFNRNLKRVEKLRRAAGDDTRLMLEVHGRWTAQYLQEFMEQARDFNISWIEDPLPAGSWHEYGLFKDSIIPICVGEKFIAVDDFRPYAAANTNFVIQADLIDCGGYDVAGEIQHLCGASERIMAFHGKRLIPSLHLAAAAPGTIRQVIEFNPIFEPERQTAMGQKILPQEGKLYFDSKKWCGLWQREY